MQIFMDELLHVDSVYSKNLQLHLIVVQKNMLLSFRIFKEDCFMLAFVDEGKMAAEQ